MPYHQLDAGTRLETDILLFVAEMRVPEMGPEGPLRVERRAGAPTIAGIEVTQAQTFINERRVLVVSYNSQEPPGTLGYTVVVRSGHSVGDHFHHRREERILLLHGRAEFRLLDERPGSPTRGMMNVFTIEDPGASVRIPTGVAHAVIADGTLTVLQVLASSDYDPADDVHVMLSLYRWE